MVIIGLMGKIKSGKTTGANYIVNRYGFIEQSFADPLKKACMELFLLEDNQVYGTQEQKETADPRWFECTPRKMLQYVGTDLLRDNLEKIMPGIGVNVFTHRFALWYQQELEKNPNLRVIISDVRFQNEVDFIHKLGGTVVKITRPITDETKENEKSKTVPGRMQILLLPLFTMITGIIGYIKSFFLPKGHISETGIDSITNYGCYINNSGTIEEYYEKLEKIVEMIVPLRVSSESVKSEQTDSDNDNNPDLVDYDESCVVTNSLYTDENGVSYESSNEKFIEYKNKYLALKETI